jgi:hypothetical protein
MKPIQVESEEIKKAISSGNTYIQVGTRKFLLCEVEQIMEPDSYEVTDPEEKKLLLDALEGENPIMSDSEIDRMLDEPNHK